MTSTVQSSSAMPIHHQQCKFHQPDMLYNLNTFPNILWIFVRRPARLIFVFHQHCFFHSFGTFSRDILNSIKVAALKTLFGNVSWLVESFSSFLQELIWISRTIWQIFVYNYITCSRVSCRSFLWKKKRKIDKEVKRKPRNV
jgi:hypothetical protein